jgi:integrase/recombinase XerD
VNGKTGQRWVYIRQDAYQWLQQYLAAREEAGIHSEHLVCAHHGPWKGHKYARNSFEQLVNRLFKQAGINHSGVHCLRHTAATLAIENGSPIEQVRALLGHASLLTTSIYVHALNKRENNPAALIPVTL